jgi:hypothetical protein
MLGYYTKGLMDTIVEKLFVGFQKKDEPPRPREQNSLDSPAGDLEERGGYEGHVIETSPYIQTSLRSALVGAVLVSSGVAALYAHCR